MNDSTKNDHEFIEKEMDAFKNELFYFGKIISILKDREFENHEREKQMYEKNKKLRESLDQSLEERRLLEKKLGHRDIERYVSPIISIFIFVFVVLLLSHYA